MQEGHKRAFGNHCAIFGCLMQPATYGSTLCAKCTADLEAGEEH